MTMSRLRSILNRPPERREASTSFSACLSAWRSEPQIPQARVLTSTSPEPGSGVGRLSTTSFLFRITVARIDRSPFSVRSPQPIPYLRCRCPGERTEPEGCRFADAHAAYTEYCPKQSCGSTAYVD